MITLEETAQATGGTWRVPPRMEGSDEPLVGGAFDTRSLGEAQIFFALSGENADGHDYLHALAGSSVRLAVVSRNVDPDRDLPGYEGAVLRVENTLIALGVMGRFLVEKHRPLVVAVTGSYGKTTTKEEIAHVIAGGRRVLKSQGSLNNEIGIPITLLELDGSQEVAVLEYSARKEGDIDELGRMAPPDVAVLLAVGHAHIGVFGSREAIYRAKGEIFNHLRPDGLALVGAHDSRLRSLAAPHRTLSFGLEGGESGARGESGPLPDYAAEDITLGEGGRQHFTGVREGVRLSLRASMPGPHGCEPVLAAWAVARELGLDDALVAERAGGTPMQKGRMDVRRALGGAMVIDDAYNASPETVVNLIQTLNAAPERDKVLVLGPLAELEEGLADTAQVIADQLGPPLGRVLLYDPSGDGLGALLQERCGDIELHVLQHQKDLIGALRALDVPGTVIGVKGARSAHMERIVQALLGVSIACGLHPCPMLMYCTDCEQLTGT